MRIYGFADMPQQESCSCFIPGDITNLYEVGVLEVFFFVSCFIYYFIFVFVY